MKTVEIFNRILSDLDAYWLGFLTADGCLFKAGKRKSGEHLYAGIACELASKDAAHLDDMKRFFDGGTIDKLNRKFGSQYRFRFCSVQLAKTLIREYGWTSDKSSRIGIPSLSDRLVRSFIRGYFDGDGCFTLEGGVKPRLSFCGCQQLMDDISVLLVDVVGTRATVHLNGKTGKCWRILYGGKKAALIRDWMYAYDSFSLPRKREKLFACN